MGSFETVLSILILVLTGHALKLGGMLREEDASSLNRIVINLAIPSLIFTSLYRADLSGIADLFLIPLVCITTGALSGTIASLWARRRGMDSRKTWGIIVAAAMMNSGFLGYPVTEGIFGSEGLLRAIFYDTGTTVMFTSLGLILSFISGAEGTAVVKRAVTFPPLWAFILGVTFNLMGLPVGIAGTVLGYLAGAAVPLIMISLGLSLNFRFLRDSLADATFVSALRLIVSPLIAAFIVYLLSFKGLDFSVTVLEASMPSAMLAAVLAIENDLDVDLVSSCIFMSTILGLVSLPAWSLIL
ncbi:AEC family transporter [Methanothermobacter sp. THM-2]|uniref:AEC family transporter n=1 Tax=Methanothermobacter sp. THM-2 TaxID=2606912 RepID=UPI0013662C7C|nr:AEC family transporter [Methanothermobacter sp. THM-2]QHN07656.1 AEC family transporter [Methanothermobacter sp. THM-2]